MAVCSLSCMSKENTNFSRLCKLLVDGGTRVLKEVFDRIHPPKDLTTNLLDPTNHGILNGLYSKKIVFKEQWGKLYPPSGSTVDSSSFDITLLCLLLRSICNLKKPAGGWNSPPPPTNTNTEDDIVRIKLARNHLGHIKEPALSDSDFSQYWNDIREVLIRLGGAHYKAEIDKLRVVSIDSEEEKYYIQCINEWRKNDENLMKELEATEKRLASKMDEVTEEVVKKVQSMLQASQIASEGINRKDAESYSGKLKSAMKGRLEVHQEFLMTPIIEKFKLEDIFTNLIIHDTPRREHSKSRKSDQFGGKTHTEIKTSADLFLDKEKTENPKSILIVGNPGIGKSLFCRKLTHEWTLDSIFNAEEGDSNPDIRFTFLITFRQLNELSDKHLNLKDLLNLCSILDESTILNNSVMQYIIAHPEQLFVLIDGFDEYKQSERHKLVLSDFENSFPNDPMTKMPVTALLSKLVKKKILRDAVVMVTSRPGEADELENFHFDRFVKVTGFSLQLVMEYVGKYFKSNEEMKAKALSNIKEHQYFLRFGRVPLMCLMMCVYMEFQITEGSNKCLPDRLTDFYSEVVQCIERKYNKAISKARLDKVTSSLVVQKNLENLSKLAARSTDHSKYSFNEDDFETLNLSEKDLTYLKSSSLLFCEDGVRKSPYSELTHSYSFSHRTFHEYFIARYFVKTYEIPAQNTLSPMTLQFMAGSMDPEKDEERMKGLLEHINEQEKDKDSQARLSLKCLYEYGDKELVNIVGEKYVSKYIDVNIMTVRHLDYRIIAMMLDIITASRSKYPSTMNIIYYSPLTLSGADVLFSSLSKESCPIRTLIFSNNNIDDECAIHLSKYLPTTKLTGLELNGNEITDSGIMAMMPFCNRLKNLDLRSHRINDECRTHAQALFKDKYPHVKLLI